MSRLIGPKTMLAVFCCLIALLVYPSATRAWDAGSESFLYPQYRQAAPCEVAPSGGSWDGFVWVDPPVSSPGGGYQPDPNAQTIDIMILYTPDTASALGDINAEAAAQVDQVNAILANSGLQTSLNLVGLVEVDYGSGDDLATTLERLATPDDGYLDEAYSWRDDYRADLVSLWDLGADNGIAGIAQVLSGWSYDTGDISLMQYQAFSVINFSYLDYLHKAHTFAHELGHNLGLEHDPWTKEHLDGGQEVGPFPYDHGYVDFEHDFITVMAYDAPLLYQGTPEEDITYLPYYSNPDLSYEGHPIGEAGVSDAAAVINQTAPWVAAYR